MLFAIYKRSGDACGNEDNRLLGYCKFNSLKEAEKEFPYGFFVGYRVYEVSEVLPTQVHKWAEKR